MDRFHSLEILWYEKDVATRLSYQSYSLQDLRLPWLSNGKSSSQTNGIVDKNRGVEFTAFQEQEFEKQKTPNTAISYCSEDASQSDIVIGVDGEAVAASSTGVDGTGDHQSPTEPLGVTTAKFIACDDQQCYEPSPLVKPLQELCSLSLRKQASIETQPQNFTHDNHARVPAPRSPLPLLDPSVEDKVLLNYGTTGILVDDPQIIQALSNEEKLKLVVSDVTEPCSPPVFSTPINDESFEAVQRENPSNLSKEHPCTESSSVLSVGDSETMMLLHSNNTTEHVDQTPVSEVSFSEEKTEVTINEATETCRPSVSSPTINYEISKTIQSKNSPELSTQHSCNESASILSVPGSETMAFDHDESLSEESDDDYGLPGSRRRSRPSEESDSSSDDDSLYSDASHKSISHYSDAADVDINIPDSQPTQSSVTEENKGSSELCADLPQTNEENVPETSDVGEELDADQDKANPAYIPRTGTYFMHDYRSSENDQAASKSDSYKSRADRGAWQHDMFRYYEQGPRSSRELVKKYGYDIRNADSSSTAPANDYHPPTSASVVSPSNREPLTYKVTDSPTRIDSHPQKHTGRSSEHEYSQFSDQVRGESYRKDFQDHPRQVNRAYTNVGNARGRFTRSSGNSYQHRQEESYITTENRHDQPQNHFTRSGSSGTSNYYRNSGNRGRSRGLHSGTFPTEQSTLNKDTLYFDDRKNNVAPETLNLTSVSSPRKANSNGPRLRGRGAHTFSVSHRTDHRQEGTGSKRYSAFRQATAASTGPMEGFSLQSHTSHVPDFPSRQAFTDPNVGIRIVAHNFDDQYCGPSRSHAGNTYAPALSEHPDSHSQNRSHQYSDTQPFNAMHFVENPTFQQGSISRLSSTISQNNRVPPMYANTSNESYHKGRSDFAPVDGSTNVPRYTHTHDTSGFYDQEPRSGRFEDEHATERRPLLGRRPFKPLELRDPRDQLLAAGEGATVGTKSNFSTENWFAT